MMAFLVGWDRSDRRSISSARSGSEGVLGASTVPDSVRTVSAVGVCGVFRHGAFLGVPPWRGAVLCAMRTQFAALALSVRAGLYQLLRLILLRMLTKTTYRDLTQELSGSSASQPSRPSPIAVRIVVNR